MALTFTKKVAISMGSKAFRLYDVTHDGSATDIAAAKLELNYVDGAICAASVFPVSSGGTSIHNTDLSTNSGATLVMAALSSGAISTIMAIVY